MSTFVGMPAFPTAARSPVVEPVETSVTSA
jgi:hypothetical protein